jgi:metallo-beta-lactamase family protein
MGNIPIWVPKPASPAPATKSSFSLNTGGRIVSHLKHGLDNPKNDLFFVGFQAKGTPGRAIVEGRTPTKAAIHHLSGYSAHADQQTLCDWVKSMPEQPGETRLVHGEPEAQKALKSKLDILF